MDRREFLAGSCAIAGIVKSEENNDLLVASVLRCDVANGNGRIYPRSVVEKIVKQYKEGGIIGTLGSSIPMRLNKISHRIIDLKIEGDCLVATAKPIDTPCGLELKKLLERKAPITMRTAGTGSINDNVVGDDFILASIDVLLSDRAANIGQPSVLS